MTLSPARPFLISPPFGSYFRSARAYSVLGSFTRLPRPGRTAQVLRTVRPLGREPDGEPKGWLNKLELRNPGWNTIPRLYRPAIEPDGPYNGRIISLVPLEPSDWHALERWLDERFQRPIIEVNISCPNVDEHPDLPPDHMIQRFIGGGATIIWKLPPVPSSVDAALRLAGLGARYLHLSNTLPSPTGGLSGKVLRKVNLPLVEKTATTLENAGYMRYRDRPDPGGRNPLADAPVELIAGGGIYISDHLRQYRDAGATRFSLATAFMNPLRGYRVIREYGR